MVEVSEYKVRKKNNLNTKFLPSFFMLFAGLISLIICMLFSYEIKRLLLIVFLSMLIFAILGTVVKTIVDSFNMKNSYEDLLEEEGAIREKN